MKELIERFKSPTPKFWRKVRTRAAAVGASLGVMIASGHMPEAVLPALQYAAFACGIVAVVASATCEDPTPPSPDTAS